MARHLAVVTGGASGVGAATAEALIAEGVSVIGVDLDWRDIASHDELIQITGDVGDDRTWARVVEAARTHPNGPLSRLVINAAYLPVGNILNLEMSEIKRAMDINVFGAVHALRACLPIMTEAGGGSIVAVASTNALFAEQDLAAYCTSKGALLQLMRCVAVDHARDGIRANIVCPGAIDTPFFRRHVDAAPDPGGFLAEKVERHPSGRIQQPDDVASAVTYLLSDAARGSNGSHLLVDGGLTATFDFHPK